MYGLLINRLYLEEILDGRKSCDAHPFGTSHRGRIALLDNKTLKVLGLADLTGVRRTDYAQFRAWQTTLKYQIPEDPLGNTKSYYFYDLENTVRLPEPLTADTYRVSSVWVFLQDKFRKRVTQQRSLADFD